MALYLGTNKIGGVRVGVGQSSGGGTSAKTLKGTWQFNDVLSAPSVESYILEQSIGFNVNGTYLVDGVEYLITCDAIEIGINSPSDIIVSYRSVSAVPVNDLLVGSFVAYASVDFGGWNPYVSEGIKTTTFTEEQEVSDEFYEWFTANAVEVGGGSGVCDKPHIIEVDELPTEDIDEDAVYKVGGNYYLYENELLDLFFIDYKGYFSIAEAYRQQGATVNLYYVTTKPTENILISTDTAINGYYVEDDNNVFVYTNGAWVLVGDIIDKDFVCAVKSITEIDECDSYTYYALIHNGWKRYVWTKSDPTTITGGVLITENGTYDVSGDELVTVECPSEAICGKWQFTFDSTNLYGLNDEQKINFTTTINGETKDCIGIILVQSSNSAEMLYCLSDGTQITVYGYGSGEWKTDDYGEGIKTIDFGEPQAVFEWFKGFITENAIPKYNIMVTE